ncbi:AAA family ATPase [Catelliglobosispora koreensis]|uniref:AAA family ATPase n=1 Tax=Catelliglobosispora koreensis TaxID=129052 RepID=UPI00036D4086|nr:SMC family ATPase [Catelliglobosispora koreensis]
MRPLRLDMRGFAAFREQTVVDFTDADFFALVGPTGAGKSTVLDAMCFALYGTAPRWGVRSVAHALAPSATEAAVRLIFEAAGARYAVTRVVRRDSKGRVSTRSAALQALSPGFDPSTLDSGELTTELGEAMAGSPAELDGAIGSVVGLPYDQFIKCVVLPQGEFAAFLHAKPAERQEILVRLLGLDVYEKVRDRATSIVSEANAQLAATEPVLLELTTAGSDEALADANEALKHAEELVAQVDASLPALAAAHEKAATVTAAVGEADKRLALFALVRAPGDVAGLAAAAQQATAAIADAAVAAGAAEEREEKLRSQLDHGPDPAQLAAVLNMHEERVKLAARLSTLDTEVKKARDLSEKAAKLLERAERDVTATEEKVNAAKVALDAAQHADRAAWMRRDLLAGHACPVCEQMVETVPPQPEKPAMAAAKQVLASAEELATKAKAQLSKVDREHREADRKLTTATAQHDPLASRLAEIDALLAGTEAPEELRKQLKTVELKRRELTEATNALRTTREAHRQATARAQQAEERMRKAWRDFDSARDTVAALAPPAPDRDDLGKAWAGLTAWAASQKAATEEQRNRLREDLDKAQAQASQLASALDRLFTDNGLPRPRTGEHQRSAAVAAERASAARERILQMRTQAASLQAQRATIEQERQVAATLAQHLRANNFEAWLLQEALEALVAGASSILRQLSGGQYDLIHDDREFFVADHHDAGLRRAVRTLSGGETFQASLALALALAEQLGGMSANASLESIMLDEGFGTLDASTLDTVAATLENLAAQGDRMVGVVTHVQSLAERIPVRFEITKDARSARVERIG